MLFVTESDDVILGVITARDTMGERPIKLLQERCGQHGDLRVAGVMTPIGSMDALLFSDVLHPELGHMLESLNEAGRQHALVLERNPGSGHEEVHGMCSATAIGRRLGVPIQTFEVAHTFAEIESALARS